MNYFLTTRKPLLIYKLYLNSFKKNFEIKYKNKKVSFLHLRNRKLPSFKYFIFLLSILVTGKIFDKKTRANISYNDVILGNHVISYAYRNFKSYDSKIYFYFYLIKYFYLAGCYIKTSLTYLKKYNFNCVYLDHLMYLNGIYYQIFAKNKKIIYSNNYPKSAYMIDFNKKKKIYYDFSNSSRLGYLKKNLTNAQEKKIEKFKKKYLKRNSKFISHMKNTKYYRLDNKSKLRFNDYQYIIFPHSFTDAQMVTGFSGFESMVDWLIFTLEFMKKNNKKAIIKAHPNFFKKDFGILSLWDKKIFENIKKRYENEKNFFFINKSVENLEVLKQLNKNCVGLTHHGTVILEMALHNFKTISSSKCPWDSRYKVSNNWSNVIEYKRLLSKKWDALNFHDKDDLNKTYYQYFLDNFSFNGKYSIHEIMKRSLNKSITSLKNNPKIFSTDASIKDISSQEKIFNKYFPVKKQEKFIKIFSNNIEEL